MREKNGFEDSASRKALPMAAEAAQPRNEQSEEQNRGPDLKIEESRYLSENKIDELGGSAILGARCRMAGRATDKWSELGKEKDEGCMTEDHHKASNVSEVKSATVLVDPWSSSTKGLWQQVDVEHQHLRLGAVEVSGNADGLHGCRPLSFLGANVSDSTNGSYELRKFCKSMSSSKDVRSKQGLVVAEQVVLQGEAVSQQHEDAKSQMRMQILNEAVKAEILDDASKDEESAESGLDDAAGNKLLRSTVFWVLVCFLLIAVFAASVTMGVFAARASGRKAGQIVNEGVGNSDTPTLAPSKSAVNLNVSTCAHFRGWGYTLFDEDPRLYEQEYLLVREELRSNLTRFDVQSLHDDECSPANLAIWWLASEYSFTASPLALGERYGLAVVFLSVKGGTSRDASGWFRSDSSECTWTGVSCRNAGIVSMAAMNVALRGSLPSEIGLLTNLGTWVGRMCTGSVALGSSNLLSFSYKEHVELSKNFIAGTLPPEISELNRLYSLNLFGNSFEGTLPSEYGGLTQLSLLNLGDTFLSGTIPTEYGDLTLLTELNLRDNAIRKGSIPSELGRLTRLGKRLPRCPGVFSHRHIAIVPLIVRCCVDREPST